MRPVTFTWLAVVIGIACAAIEWLGIAGWMAVAVVAASVAMHVAGNALGTQLRESTDRDLRRLRTAATEMQPLPRPRSHRLGQRTGLGLLVPVSAGIGAACGGVAGTSAISAAVIGGLVGFLGASFVEIVRVSLREALAAEGPQAGIDR